MKAPEEKLETFLRRELASGEASRFELHRVTDGARQKIRTWDASLDVAELAAEIATAAEDDASGSSAVVETYAAFSFAGGSRQYREQSPRWRVFTDRVRENDAADIESAAVEPSHKAQWGQILRHNEAIFRAALARSAEREESREKLIDTLLGRLNEAYDERFDMIEAVQKIALQTREVEREERREAAREKMIGESFQALKLLAPSLLAKAGIASPAALPGESPHMMAMKDFLDSLSPEQASAMMSTLSPTQMAAFARLAEGLAETERTDDHEPTH